MEDFLNRYSRTILVNGIDFEGQKKISKSKVLIVGSGGLSSVIISILVSSGLHTVYLVEPDVLELSNLQRQFIYKSQDVGERKDILAKKFADALNPNVNFTIVNHINDAQDIDLIIDGTDSFKSRIACNALAIKLQIPFFTGSAIGFTGHVYSFFSKLKTGCYACLFGDNTNYEEEKTCANSGVFPAMPSVIGSIIAHNALFFLSYKEIKLEEFFSKFILVDFLKQKYFKELTFQKDTQCKACQTF